MLVRGYRKELDCARITAVSTESSNTPNFIFMDQEAMA